MWLILLCLLVCAQVPKCFAVAKYLMTINSLYKYMNKLILMRWTQYCCVYVYCIDEKFQVHFFLLLICDDNGEEVCFTIFEKNNGTEGTQKNSNKQNNNSGGDVIIVVCIVCYFVWVPCLKWKAKQESTTTSDWDYIERQWLREREREKN